MLKHWFHQAVHRLSLVVLVAAVFIRGQTKTGQYKGQAQLWILVNIARIMWVTANEGGLMKKEKSGVNTAQEEVFASVLKALFFKGV